MVIYLSNLMENIIFIAISLFGEDLDWDEEIGMFLDLMVFFYGKVAYGVIQIN